MIWIIVGVAVLVGIGVCVRILLTDNDRLQQLNIVCERTIQNIKASNRFLIKDNSDLLTKLVDAEDRLRKTKPRGAAKR